MSNTELDSKIDEFFADFWPTITLLEELAASRKYPQEIILLACARLDALASIAFPNLPSSTEQFSKFILDYGRCKRLLGKVSVGDLYWEILYRSIFLLVAIEPTGRIKKYRDEDDLFIQFLEECTDVPLTIEDMGRVLSRILEVLRKQFRVIPRQSPSKHETATIRDVVECIRQGFDTPRRKYVLETLVPACENYVRSMTLARILYRKVRCQVIHGGAVGIDERRFFREKSPYWASFYSDPLDSNLMDVEFPAAFLIQLLKNTIETYKHHLKVKGTLPIDIYNWIYDDLDESIDHWDQVDKSTVSDGKILRFKR